MIGHQEKRHPTVGGAVRSSWFTGVGANRFAVPAAVRPARVGGAIVTFEPGARTAWHTHPLGQALIVVAGCGTGAASKAARSRKSGRATWCGSNLARSTGTVHAPATAMTHIAIAEALDGKVVEWMEQVSDAEHGQ